MQEEAPDPAAMLADRGYGSDAMIVLVRALARQAAEEDWKKALEAQRAAKRAAADGEDEGRKDNASPTKSE